MMIKEPHTLLRCIKNALHSPHLDTHASGRCSQQSHLHLPSPCIPSFSCVAVCMYDVSPSHVLPCAAEADQAAGGGPPCQGAVHHQPPVEDHRQPRLRCVPCALPPVCCASPFIAYTVACCMPPIYASMVGMARPSDVGRQPRDAGAMECVSQGCVI